MLSSLLNKKTALALVVLATSVASVNAHALSIEEVLEKLPGVVIGANYCDEVPKQVEGMTPKAMLKKGESLLGKRKTACEAGRYFFEIQRQYPHSKEYKVAQIRYIEALRIAGDYKAAINEANTFMEINRGSPRVEQAHYQIVLAVKEQFRAAKKGQEWAEYALGVGQGQDASAPYLMNLSFQTFLDLYPESPKAREVQEYLNDARERMASQYFEVGLYYYERSEYRAAIGRFAFIAQAGRLTSSFEPALYYLVQSYKGFARSVRSGDISDRRLAGIMGEVNMKKLDREAIARQAEASANEVAEGMRKNLPNSPWTKKLSN